MKKGISIAGVLLLIVIMVSQTVAFSQKNKPSKTNYVPDKETAIKIAEAIWLPIYGKEIYLNKPFVAKLKNGIWYVEGSLPKYMNGGVPYIEIQKSDGRILNVYHDK